MKGLSRRGLVTGAAALAAYAALGQGEAYSSGVPFGGPKRSILGGATPIIDWRNPLTVGLLAAYATPSSGALIKNLVGLGGDLVLGSGGAWGNTPEGRGLDHGASNGQAQVATPTVLQLAKRQSMFWRGVLGSTPATDTGVFDVSFTNTDTSPFNSYGLLYLSSANISAVASNGTSLSLASAAPASIGPATSLGMTSDQISSGLLILYQNGKQSTSVAIGTGTSTTYASSLIGLGGYPPVTTRTAPGTRSLCAFIWNRVLSAGEQLALHFDPYQFLLYPEDLTDDDGFRQRRPLGEGSFA